MDRLLPLLARMAALLALALPLRAPAQGCEAPACVAERQFTVRVTDLRSSSSGPVRYLTLALQVRNTSAAPLALAYEFGTGLVTDDQGNRYDMAAEPRGIGQIAGRSVDAAFQLQPGESGDVRFEFRWNGQDKLHGTVYEVRMALRELQPVAGGQVRLGKEFALQFRGLRDSREAPPVAAAPTRPAGPPAEPASAAPRRELCAGRARCYDGGAFTAELVRAQPSAFANNWQYLTMRLTLRLRNESDRPLALAYQAASQSLQDEDGHRYVDAAFARPVTGMTMVDSRNKDVDFVLGPGEAREVVFEPGLQLDPKERGSVYSWDLALEQYAPAAGRQLQRVRTHSISFPRFEVAPPSAATQHAQQTAEHAASAPVAALKSLKDALGALRTKKP